MSHDREFLEFAALQRENGAPIIRTRARESFLKFQDALKRAGGREPRGSDGRHQAWNSTRGWHDETTATPAGRSRPRTVATLQARQRLVGARIRQATVLEMVRKDDELLRASPLAWKYAKLFAQGRQLQPGASTHEERGWQLWHAGYIEPPARRIAR